MLPMIEALADGRERTMRELTDLLSDRFGLTEDERREVLPSGQQSVFSNRVAWAKSHLKAAGLLENPLRGRVRISDSGRKVLAKAPQAINIRFLRQFPSYCEFIGKAQPKDVTVGEVEAVTPIEEQRTPLELIDAAYRSLRQATTEERLSRLRACSPAFFESIVVRLLMAMGYGGVAGHGTVAGRSGDGGIDGVIRQDGIAMIPNPKSASPTPHHPRPPHPQPAAPDNLIVPREPPGSPIADDLGVPGWSVVGSGMVRRSRRARVSTSWHGPGWPRPSTT